MLRDNDKNITLDIINNKKDLINKIDKTLKTLIEVNTKVTNKVKYINIYILYIYIYIKQCMNYKMKYMMTLG